MRWDVQSWQASSYSAPPRSRCSLWKQVLAKAPLLLMLNARPPTAEVFPEGMGAASAEQMPLEVTLGVELRCQRRVKLTWQT